MSSLRFQNVEQGEKVVVGNKEHVDGENCCKVGVEKRVDGEQQKGAIQEGERVDVETLEQEYDEDFEEDLIDIQWDNAEESDIDDELVIARQKVRDYFERKRKICSSTKIGDDSAHSMSARRHKQSDKSNFESDKVQCYESDYFDESDPGDYIEIEGSSKDDAQRVKSSQINYNPRDPITGFKVGLQFENLKSFRSALADFST
ncbi:hypothetical protein PTKIN_Ptkin12aG0094400 [Pterospermum kingtungense]